MNVQQERKVVGSTHYTDILRTTTVRDILAKADVALAVEGFEDKDESDYIGGKLYRVTVIVEECFL